MKVGLYARVSTSDQDCSMQLQELREFCARCGWRITEEYVDHGWSGIKADRPAFVRLMKDAAARRFEAIIVWKIDRFGRSFPQFVANIMELDRLGIRFLATSQGIDTDKNSAMSRLLLHLLAAFAEFEREMIRERVAAGLRAAAAKGKYPGRPKRVFDREEANRLRWEKKQSLAKIAKISGVSVMMG